MKDRGVGENAPPGPSGVRYVSISKDGNIVLGTNRTVAFACGTIAAPVNSGACSRCIMIEIVGRPPQIIGDWTGLLIPEAAAGRKLRI